MEQFNLINYCIRACFSLHCKLFQCIWTIYTARPSNGKHGKNAVLLKHHYVSLRSSEGLFNCVDICLNTCTCGWL